MDPLITQEQATSTGPLGLGPDGPQYFSHVCSVSTSCALPRFLQVPEGSIFRLPSARVLAFSKLSSSLSLPPLSSLSPGWSFPDSVPPGTRHLNASVLSSNTFSRGNVETSGTSPSGGADIPWLSSYFSKAGVPGGISWVVKQSKAPASPDLHGRPSRLCSINLMAAVLCMIWFFPQARAIYLNHLSWHKVKRNVESWVAFPNHRLLTVFLGATSD